MPDGRLRIDSAAGTTHLEPRHGRAYARLAGVEHDVINAGTAPLSFVEVGNRRLLVEVLRDVLALTGTHVSCDTS